MSLDAEEDMFDIKGLFTKLRMKGERSGETNISGG
jgi:hypothetical protein